MTLHRKDVMAALQSGIQALELGDVGFPPLEIDGEDLQGWIDAGGGLQHTANLLSGEFEVTIDSGPENQWEGVRGCTLAYGATGTDTAARQALRDLVVPALEAFLQADRTLGLGDPQVYAQLGKTQEDDKLGVVDAGAASVAIAAIDVTYVAASAAG